MGKRQDSLTELLKTVAQVGCPSKIGKPNIEDLKQSILGCEVLRVYHELGGILDDFPVRLGSWDLNVDGIAVELDEELHFNRYRKFTLESSSYSELNYFPIENYRQYCVNYEENCKRAGKYGGKWTNSSCEKQFGKASIPPDLPCDLSSGGAPRWKQRAFYDYIKDISPLVIKVKVARISIWDEIQVEGEMVRVSRVLDKGMRSAAKSIYSLIVERSGVNIPSVRRQSGLN